MVSNWGMCVRVGGGVRREEEERSDLKKFYTRRRVQYLQKSQSLGPFRKLSYPTVDIFMPDYRQKYDNATKDCKPEDGRDEVVEN